MTIHKLLPEQDRWRRADGRAVVADQELYDVGDAIVRARADPGLRSRPRRRTRSIASFAARCAASSRTCSTTSRCDAACAAQRMGEGSAAARSPRACSSAAEGYAKGEYISCWFRVWADSRARSTKCARACCRRAGDQRLRDQMFTSTGTSATSRGDLQQRLVRGDRGRSAAGRGIPVTRQAGERVRRRATWTRARRVLILLGPAGHAARRAWCAPSSRRSRAARARTPRSCTPPTSARCENDEIFVEFITGSHDAFVIEDADHAAQGAHQRQPRTCIAFSAIADGVARAQSRKIIFTTNLPNISDIDDALMRPGRCYAVKNLRSLDAGGGAAAGGEDLRCGCATRRAGVRANSARRRRSRTRWRRSTARARERGLTPYFQVASGRRPRTRSRPDRLRGTSRCPSCCDTDSRRSSRPPACLRTSVVRMRARMSLFFGQTAAARRPGEEIEEVELLDVVGRALALARLLVEQRRWWRAEFRSAPRRGSGLSRASSPARAASDASPAGRARTRTMLTLDGPSNDLVLNDAIRLGVECAALAIGGTRNSCGRDFAQARIVEYCPIDGASRT